MEDTDTKDSLQVHLILGASDYAKIKMETAPRIGALGEPIGEKTKLGWTIMLPGKEVDLSTMFFTQTSSADYERLYRLDVLGLADSSVGDQQEVYSRSSCIAIQLGGMKLGCHGEEITHHLRTMKPEVFVD